MAANLETGEKDSIELEKRLKINEERERVLKQQLDLHYKDLKIAANPTARLQLEKGIQSILEELRVLRAASNKFLSKMRQIADGLEGIEKNEFIREHRLDERIGSTIDSDDKLKASLHKITKDNKRTMKTIVKRVAKKFSKKAAKQAEKKAEAKAKTLYGNDVEKINSEKKKALKSVYKKSYKEIMSKVQKAGVVGKKEIKEKAEGTAADLLSSYKVDDAIDAAESKVIIKNIVNKVMGKPTLTKKQVQKKIAQKKPSKQLKQMKKQVLKQKKELEKKKIEKKKAEIKMKIAKKNEQKKGVKIVKLVKKESELSPYRIKRHIERRVVGIEKLAKEDGIKTMPQQEVKAEKTKKMLMPTMRDGEMIRKRLGAEASRNTLAGMRAAQRLSNRMLRDQMNAEQQREYLEELSNGMPVQFDDYYVDPMAIQAQYNEVLM